MRDKVRDAIDQLRMTSDRADAGTKSALGRFFDRRRDDIDPALDEVVLALREFADARVVSTQQHSTLEIGPLPGGMRSFIRFALEDGEPGMDEVVRVRAEWGDGGLLDRTHSLDELDRERVDDYLEQFVPSVLSSRSA
jgi:hypothetical protein